MSEIERAKERIVKTLENNGFRLIEDVHRLGWPWDGEQFILTFLDDNGDEITVEVK